MTNKISNRTLEAMSAYLDDELSPGARRRLETRLEQDPDLRVALEGLQRTRALLRSQPSLRAPRNFTLTPQMAGVRAGRRASTGAYPMLRLASALAAIFLLIAVVGELFATTLQPAQVQVVQDARPPSAFAPGLGGGGGGGSDAPEEKVAQPEESSEMVPEGETRGGEPLMDAAAPTEAAAEMLLAPTQVPLPTGTPTPEPANWWAPGGWSLMRLLQISLAVLAVGAGLAAFALRRSAGGR